jgi:hypothetical protein
MVNILCHKGNTNQNDTVIPSHPCQDVLIIQKTMSKEPVAHTCNSSYSGDSDQENCG